MTVSPAARFFSDPGAPLCEGCPPGRFATAGSFDCDLCPSGSFCPGSVNFVPCRQVGGHYVPISI